VLQFQIKDHEMTAAAEYVHAYQNQTGSDSKDTVELLADFLVSYGMADAAVQALCQLIDEEAIETDFGQYLRESGWLSDLDDRVGGDDSFDDTE
jgi:hypothetical protein